MPASYPTSAKAFTTKVDGTGNTILAAHINDLQAEVTAVETDLIAGLPLGRGGTGLTSLTANRIPYSTGSAFTSAAGLAFDGTTFTAPAATIAGLVDLSGASAGQVKFPATQNASADANTLDDYEEGTWTPSLGGSATYTSREGRYTKVGNKVTLVGSIVVNSIGTGSTTDITGVPFAEGGAGTAPVVVGVYSSIATSSVEVKGALNASTISILAKNAASTGNGTSAVFGNGAAVDFSCTYLV